MAAMVPGTVPEIEPIPKPEPGFFQAFTPALVVETDVSAAYAKKLAQIVQTAEMRFYKLFKLTPELLKGVSRIKFDDHHDIAGTIIWDLGFHQYTIVRAYKDRKSYEDEWFAGRQLKDKAERLRLGAPAAYFNITWDKDKKKLLRSIRTYVANRDDSEMERLLLHEMGHLFMKSFLLEFDGGPPAGQEEQKRGTPSWLQEGLAQLFENIWSTGAASQKNRLRQQAMIYEAVQNGDNSPFQDFINITNAHNLTDIASNPLRATLNYAQSMSVMDFMVNVDSVRFFNFLQNLRAANFEKNLRRRDDHIPELYSYQDEACKKAFGAGLAEAEAGWKKHLKTYMEGLLKKQPEIYYWIGEYYLLRGKDKEKNWAKAEENFSLAMTKAPAKGEGYLGMGRLALAKGDVEKALATLAKAVQLLPKDDEAWNSYGMAQLRSKKVNEACESFNQAIKIYPRNALALAGLGNAAFASAQYGKAAETFGQAYEADQKIIYLFLKGQAGFFARDYKQAESDFASFCEVFPNDVEGQFWYGLTAQRLGDLDLAIKKLEAARTLNSNPKDTRMENALELAKKGKTFRFALEAKE
jgi:tetratricopeptide (TPR) repeat protein